MKIEYACMYINHATFIIKLKQKLEESLKWKKNHSNLNDTMFAWVVKFLYFQMVRRLTQNAKQVGISVNFHPRTIKIFVQNF